MCVFLFACVWLIPDSIIVLYHILCLTTTLLFHLQICFSSTSLTFFSITIRIISLSFTTSSFFISVMPVSPDIQYIHRLLWFVLTRSILFPFAWTPSYLSICGNFPQLLRSLLFASSFDVPVSLCRHLVDYCQWRRAKLQTCLIFRMVFWRESNQLYSTGWPFVPFLHKCVICFIYGNIKVTLIVLFVAKSASFQT